jgi:hypothetical protein
VVDGGVGVDVGAGGDLADALLDVAEEAGLERVALGVGDRLDRAQVVVERELDVHVQLATAGERERDVGDRACGGCGLLAVADALDEAGGAQDVVGHALAPLATRLRAGEGLAQRLGAAGEGLGGAQRLCEALLEAALLLGALAAHLVDQRAHALELSPGVLELGADGLAVGVERLGHHVALVGQGAVGGLAAAGQLLTGDRDDGLDGRVHLGGLLLAQGGHRGSEHVGHRLAGRRQRRRGRRGRAPDEHHDERGDAQHGDEQGGRSEDGHGRRFCAGGGTADGDPRR